MIITLTFVRAEVAYLRLGMQLRSHFNKPVISILRLNLTLMSVRYFCRFLTVGHKFRHVRFQTVKAFYPITGTDTDTNAAQIEQEGDGVDKNSRA